MKPEEASRIIRDSYIPKMYKTLEKPLDVAIEALKKQIAKPIHYRTEPIGGGIHGLFYECPNCKVDVRHVVKSDYLCKYCPECGQKLRWE